MSTAAVDRLAARLVGLEKQVRGLSAPSLAYSAVEGGAIELRDETGGLTGIVGQLPDGSGGGVTPVNGDLPPVPSSAVLTPIAGGLRVRWDGSFAGGEITPANLGRVEVHVGDAPGFYAPGDQPRATVESPLGGDVLIVPLAVSIKYVVLVARSTSGLASAPSAEVSATPSSVVSQATIDAIQTEVDTAEAAALAAQTAADDAQADATAAAQAATAAQTTADGKGRVYYDAAAPASGTAYDIWFNPNEGYRPYRWSNGAWTASTFGGGAILSGAISSTHLADLAVTSAKVADNAVTTAKIADLAIAAGKLALGAVGSTHLADLAVTAAKVADNAVTTAKIATDAITATELAAGAVIAGKIGALAITTGDLAANAVTAAKIAANTITAAEIAANTITAGQIAADTITAGQIATNAITSTELNAGAVVAGKIGALAITTGDLAAGAITTAKIAALAVTAGEIAAGAVTAGKIAALSITAGDIAAGAITAGKIAALSIVAGDIAANAIVADKIATGAVVADKIEAGAITTAKIAAGAITADHIAAGAITADKLTADAINGKTITGATFRTHATERRLEMNVYGLRGIDSFGEIVGSINHGNSDSDPFQIAGLNGNTVHVSSVDGQIWIGEETRGAGYSGTHIDIVGEQIVIRSGNVISLNSTTSVNIQHGAGGDVTINERPVMRSLYGGKIFSEGKVTVAASTNNIQDQTITFPTAHAAAPTVTVTPLSSIGLLTTRLFSVSTTTAVIRYQTSNGATISLATTTHYQAIS